MKKIKLTIIPISILLATSSFAQKADVPKIHAEEGYYFKQPEQKSLVNLSAKEAILEKAAKIKAEKIARDFKPHAIPPMLNIKETKSNKEGIVSNE